jgi:hypothetical protein
LTEDPEGENESEGAGEDHKRFGKSKKSLWRSFGERHVLRENVFERNHDVLGVVREGD